MPVKELMQSFLSGECGTTAVRPGIFQRLADKIMRGHIVHRCHMWHDIMPECDHHYCPCGFRFPVIAIMPGKDVP